MTSTNAALPSSDRLHGLITPIGTTWFAQLREGLAAPIVGLRVLWLRPSLWKYAFLPLLLNLLITAAVLFAVIAVVIAFAGLLHPWVSQQWTGIWWYVALSLELLTVVVLIMVCVAVAMISWRLLTGVLCGYAYGRLAAKVEAELGTPPGQLGEISLGHEIRDTLYDLAFLVVVLLISLLISLIPFVGPPLALVYGLYYQLLACGREYFSYPLLLRGQRRQQRLEFTNRHHMHTLGLGTVVLAFEFIPIFGALMMVTAAAGGVILHKRLEVAEASEIV